MDSGYRPQPNAPFPDPWQDEPLGEAYAPGGGSYEAPYVASPDPYGAPDYTYGQPAEPYADPGQPYAAPGQPYADPGQYAAQPYVDPGQYAAEQYAEPEPAFLESGAYASADGLPTLVSPWLVHQLSAVPMMLDGFPAVEIVMSIVRDYDRAAQVCPHEGYELLGWHHPVMLAIRANKNGRWTSFMPSVGAFQPQPSGDGAAVDLDRHETSAAFRFIPESAGPVDFWAFVSVNGVYMPFDDMMSSALLIDTNGAAKLSVSL